LQQHYRKRRWHIAIVFFFSTTSPQKKTMAHYCRLLLVKHKIDKHTKKKQKEGRDLTFKLPLYPLTFGCHFYPFISNAFS
jgi:hypothetical protein